MAALPLACHSTMKPYFYGVLDIFHKLSQFWSPLILSLQAVFSKTTGVPSLGLHSKPHFPARMTHNSGWDVQSCSTDHTRSSYFVLPSRDHPLCSPLIP